MSYEYLLVDAKTCEKAKVQVKTGDVPLNIGDYLNSKERVFLFQANEIYQGSTHENVVCITRQVIVDFLMGSLSWLPGIFAKKLALISLGLTSLPK